MEAPLQLSQALRDEGIPMVVAQLGRGTLHASVSGVRVTALEYRYPHLQRPVLWQEYGCRLASLDDLACLKLSAIAQRGARIDFVDLHALLQEHKSLKKMLRLYARKFAIADLGHLLYALGYFDDAEREPMPKMLWQINWRRIKGDIQRQVKAVAG